MYDGRTLRYLGLGLTATAMVGLVLCAIALFDQAWALAAGKWLAGAASCFVVLYVMWGDRAMALRERAAEAARIESINAERELRNRERELRLAPPAPRPEPTADYTADWRVMAHRFLWWGDRYEFGVRHLGVEGQPGHCIGWDDWGVMRTFLVEAGVLTGAGQNTRWNAADGWNWEKWQESRATMALPLRTFEPPTVAIPVQQSTPQHPQHATEAVGG